MKNVKTLIASALIATAGVAYVAVNQAPVAQAQASDAKAVVERAKAKGVIGETIAGYLAVVSGANPSAGERAAMNEINIGRKAVYTRRAREKGVGLDEVARVTGEAQIAKAKPGEKVLLSDGSWSSK